VALPIIGPLFAEWMEPTAEVLIIPFDTQFTTTCATADLVLSQAGYNSINELVALGAQAICIPGLMEARLMNPHQRIRTESQDSAYRAAFHILTLLEKV
jgi:predicted glycosyltransferase